MIKVTTTTAMTTGVTTMITTTTKTLAELDSKIQYFATMHDCSCLLMLVCADLEYINLNRSFS